MSTIKTKRPKLRKPSPAQTAGWLKLIAKLKQGQRRLPIGTPATYPPAGIKVLSRP